jgi:hypothetical protein
LLSVSQPAAITGRSLIDTTNAARQAIVNLLLSHFQITKTPSSWGESSRSSLPSQRLLPAQREEHEY